jgi:nitrate/nitrite transporter NarK
MEGILFDLENNKKDSIHKNRKHGVIQILPTHINIMITSTTTIMIQRSNHTFSNNLTLFTNIFIIVSIFKQIGTGGAYSYSTN